MRCFFHYVKNKKEKVVPTKFMYFLKIEQNSLCCIRYAFYICTSNLLYMLEIVLLLLVNAKART